MSNSPISIGDTSAFHNAFTTDTGAVFPLTGLSTGAFAMHFIEQPNGTMRVGTGTWNITNAASGLADYTPSSADVGTAGVFSYYPVITLPSGAPKAFRAQLIEIQNLP